MSTDYAKLLQNWSAPTDLRRIIYVRTLLSKNSTRWSKWCVQTTPERRQRISCRRLCLRKTYVHVHRNSI